ncbi:hypothetical protein SKAU_G00274810 [Synaphobranchus kaupii]|uniref:Protein kinase domain-containing protein n=1 Tax=Synaphobranchus kaupii TaxID=118154 RepID=A0A9Q1F111_SYNKA|nr:hypothetical protein SKAU_G00274810 [Synaphobranchus kaupii]
MGSQTRLVGHFIKRGGTQGVTMATRSRILNSTSPFVALKGQKWHLEGHSSPGGQKSGEEEEPPAPCEISPVLKKVMALGTAEDMAARPQGTEKLCLFTAQAECDERQEFSPSCSERPYIGSPNCLRRRGSTEHNNVACKERPAGPCPSSNCPQPSPSSRNYPQSPCPVKNCPQSPQQESNGAPWLFHTQDEAPEFPSRYSSTQSLGVQETERPRWDSPQPSYGQRLPHSQAQACAAPQPWSASGFDTSYSQESTSERHLSSQDNWGLARFGLRGNVCQEDRVFTRPFFKELESEARAEEEGQPEDSDTNEGLLLTEKLRSDEYEYREGRDYSVLRHIRNGSYGDVYSVQDNRTGFKCAAKKILLRHFNSEEVGSWSALDSPRVVELYGAVREGPWVILFMGLKSGSVGQLLRERGRLPEDLALHYLSQVSGALEHLQKRRVLHLDIKADNILLSEDGKETFLSDFGHSERLDRNGWSTKANSGEGFQGTETHMAPEVVKGEPRGAKADVWSSCCMLLHMLNGCHPWTRYYSSPLCLKIANEDPPLREIPSNCNPCTGDVIRAGLQKDPIKRASASELKERTTRALLEVGGLTSPVKGAYQEPATAEPMETRHQRSGPLPSLPASPSPTPSRKRSTELGVHCGSSWREHSNDEEEEEEGCEADWLSSSSGPPLSFRTNSSRQQKGEWPGLSPSVWELENEFYRSSLSQPHSLELQERLLSCLSSGCNGQRDDRDKDSKYWSGGYSGNYSSGVFSCGSQPDGHSFGVDRRGSAHLTPCSFFEGVDVSIQDFNGQCLHIREAPGVKVGHIATGISDQISESTFSLETRDGRPVSPEEEVLDSGLWLRCTSTSDSGRPWRWRVREGVLETRE